MACEGALLVLCRAGSETDLFATGVANSEHIEDISFYKNNVSMVSVYSFKIRFGLRLFSEL